ncbi:MAG: sulfotransferase, partial [Paracoccaceae bacterium]|nr:sulfotransferase [Paracoccaceae bacterium]
MKLILHIGMGKTGTSSIQNALRTSSVELAEQNVQYLGMWFDAIDPRFNGSLGTREFFALDEEAMQSAATLFLENLNRINAERGIETFVLSNEAIFGAVHRIKPFILALCEQIDVKIVIYIRDPHSWLPSAYTQWSLYHKSVKGPLRSFSEHAPELLSMYQNIEHWLNDFSDHIIARPHIS